VLAAALAVAFPAAPALARLPSGFVGIASEDVYYNAGVYRSQSLAAERRAGVRLIRQQFTWESIERSPGRYDLSYLDSYVGAAAANGIRLLPTLSDAPAFYERPTHQRGFPPPRDYGKMAAFARVLVKRYGPRGSLWTLPQFSRYRRYAIRSWQIWNEPSLPVYWPPRPSAREYARLLKVVGRAIKREDRRAEIVTAGLPNSKLPGAVPPTRFIAALYRYAGRSAFDTLAFNAYARDARELRGLLFAIRRVMNSRGDRRAPIWITELGWGDRGPRHRFIVGARGQARRISSSFRLIQQLRRRLRIRGLVYFSWRDLPQYGRGDLWGLHTGLLRLDGSRKPAYQAFVRAVRGFR
jgi:hypothetical protein